MAQLMIRNLDRLTKERLRRRADGNGRSMEEEVREILLDALRAYEDDLKVPGLGTQLAALFRGRTLKRSIPELRGYRLKPPSLN